MANPPKVCACGAEFMPTANNYARAIRCPACKAARDKKGSATRPSKKARDARSRPARERERGIQRVLDRPKLGLDGEGFNVKVWEDPEDLYNENYEERHHYRYMSGYGTDGQVYRLEATDGDWLHTNDILWWLWKITKGYSCWFFSGKYDWTKIFTDIAISDYEVGSAVWQIYHADQYPDKTPRDPFIPVEWKGWKIVYIQGTVKIGREFWNKDKGEFFTIWRIFQDAFRCFGPMSFVDQLRSWEVGTPEEVDEIERMKEKRSHFTELTDEVRSYCDHEVKLLAELADKVTGIFADIDIRPSAWYSTGSAAKCLLRTNRIPADPKNDWEGFRGPDRYAGAPEDIITILLRSYYGGWFENAETGIFPELHSEDFKSAYPATIKTLPCLSHGKWVREYVPGAVNFGHVEWEPADDRDLRWAPFPWRWPNGRVYRPYQGEGWYCEAEVRAAQRLPGYTVTEIEWVAFVPECDHQPFGWVQEVYDKRVAWGGEGKGLALKYTLNSVYGVFADTLQLDSRYASIVWASMITAGTRAKIVDLMADHGDNVVSVATDGILSTAPVLAKKTKVLGELNYEGALTDVFLIQPGLYLATEGPDPKKTVRNRGHALKDMRQIEAQLRDAWLLEGWQGSVGYKRTRFIPGKLALARKDVLGEWGQWREAGVSVKFYPSNREPVNEPGPHKRSAPSARHVFMIDPASEDMMSAPYNKLVSMQRNADMIAEKELRDAQP